MEVTKLIDEGLLQNFGGKRIDNDTDLSMPLLMLNPKSPVVDVGTTERVALALLCTEPVSSKVTLRLAKGAKASVAVICLSSGVLALDVEQQGESESRITTALLSDANFSCNIRLQGEYATSEFDGLYIAADREHASVVLNVRHEVSDCKSRSMIKGVAAGRATGEFRGLVYVAQDAQRTDAEQQNRNVELDESHIIALPQLEIYADDVRCSHGSTVGRADEEAVFYMRQRGLSESDARRLLLEGFVQEVAQHCDVPHICALMGEEIDKKLLKI